MPSESDRLGPEAAEGHAAVRARGLAAVRLEAEGLEALAGASQLHHGAEGAVPRLRDVAELLEGRLADAPARGVHDAYEVDVVVRVGDDAEIGDDVLYLLAAEEGSAARDLVGHVLREEGLLDPAGEGVGPDEDAELVVGDVLLAPHGVDAASDELGLSHLVLRRVELDGRAAEAVRGPEGLFLAVRVVRDDGVRRREDGRGRAIVPLELDHSLLHP